MKKITYILGSLLFILSLNSLVLAVPWTDSGSFQVKMANPKDLDRQSDRWYCIWPEFQHIYENRFGGFPNYMLWKDDPQPTMIAFGVVYYIITEEFENESPWTSPIRYIDVKDYLFWKMENLITGKIFYIPVTSDNDNRIIETKYYGAIGWAAAAEIDAWSLSLDDDTAYSLSLEVWNGQPSGGKLIAESASSVIVVRANHETSIDEYLDQYFNNELGDDPDFLVNHITTYPFHYMALSVLQYQYFLQADCDSLKWITSQLLYTLENELDPFYSEININGDIKTGPVPHSPELRTNLLNHVMDVCGDTLLPPPWRTQ